MTHNLNIVKDMAEDYMHGQDFPRITASCSCGEWKRTEVRFNAHEQVMYDLLAGEHSIHASRVACEVAKWPAAVDGLHRLLRKCSGDRIEGPYRVSYVPYKVHSWNTSEAAAIPDLLEAAMAEFVDANVTDGSVELSAAPTLAAFCALLELARLQEIKVRAWCVLEPRFIDFHDMPRVVSAHHTEAEANLWQSFWEAKGDYSNLSVAMCPASLYQLMAPGTTPNNHLRFVRWE